MASFFLSNRLNHTEIHTLMLEGIAVHIWIIHSSLVRLNLEYLTNRADDDVMSVGWQRMFWIPEKQRSYSFSFVVGLLSFIVPIPICLYHTSVYHIWHEDSSFLQLLTISKFHAVTFGSFLVVQSVCRLSSLRYLSFLAMWVPWWRWRWIWQVKLD